MVVIDVVIWIVFGVFVSFDVLLVFLIVFCFDYCVCWKLIYVLGKLEELVWLIFGILKVIYVDNV